MRCKLILFALLFALPAFAQEVRVDQSLLTPGPNVPGFGFPRPQALIQANATVNLCAHPSSINSCTPITTYSDSTGGTACPPYAQLTILPGSVCTASVGTSAKMGFWYAGGTVDYYVTENGQTLGPYSVTYATSSFNGGFVANAISAPGFTGALTGGVTGHASLDLALVGGSLTGPLNVGTTQYIDSSFYSTFALACAAAVTANAPLLVSKTWTNIPTQSCGANLQFPVGGTATVLQPAANATLTLSGIITSPLVKIFDIDSNSGAALIWNSPTKLYPDYFGALGVGSGNDGIALNDALLTAINSKAPFNNPPVYLALNKQYYSTQLLNAQCLANGQSRQIIGDASGGYQWSATTIIVAATSGSQGAMLDGGGCDNAVYRNFSLTAPGGVPSASSKATSGLLISNGRWTSGYNDEAGGGTLVENMTVCGGYNTATTSGLDTAAVVVIGADLVTLRHNTLGCNGGGHGSGLVIGVDVGHSTAVNSALYTFNPAPGEPTRLTLDDNTIYGDYEPPLQLTGGNYIVNGGYIASIGHGTQGNEIDINPTVGSVGLSCQLLNTEDQTSFGITQNVFSFEVGVFGVNCNGRFNTVTGALVYMASGVTASRDIHINNSNGLTASLFNFASTSVQVNNSSFNTGYNTAVSVGTITGAFFGDDSFTLNLSCPTIASAITAVTGSGNNFHGSGGCVSYSDLATPKFSISGGHVYTRWTEVSCSLTPAAVAANVCAWQTLSCTGILNGDFVTLGFAPATPAHVNAGQVQNAGNNALSINFCADGTGGTPASGTYFFEVKQ